MLVKKICMIGAFSVGKTSLVQQYVHTIFSDRYLSTIGVKISKKHLALDGQDVELIIWDMGGKDDFVDINMPYLRGAVGFLIIADGTRGDTLDIALELKDRALRQVGEVPFLILLNKADIHESWEVDETKIALLREQNMPLLLTSAKTGQSVAEAFETLARAMTRDQI